MNKDAIEARRAYKREWQRKNKDKVKMYQENYWSKKALEMLGALSGKEGAEHEQKT
jgi:hypothetical protein